MIGLFEGLGVKSPFSIADIERIGKAETISGGTLTMREVRLRNGDRVRLADVDVGLLMTRPVQIMPAEAGTSIVQFHNGFETFLVPVTGWALCVDGEVRPLTFYGVHTPTGLDRDDIVYMQGPDGRIFAGAEGFGLYDSLEDLIEEKREVERRQAAIQLRDAEKQAV